MRARPDNWLLAILALSVVLNSWHLQWGLPNGNHSWAADGIGPVTALSVARRNFGSWNSGWFYFKYPTAWPFLMVAASAPYLGWLYLTAAGAIRARPIRMASPIRSGRSSSWR